MSDTNHFLKYFWDWQCTSSVTALHVWRSCRWYFWWLQQKWGKPEGACLLWFCESAEIWYLAVWKMRTGSAIFERFTVLNNILAWFIKPLKTALFRSSRIVSTITALQCSRTCVERTSHCATQDYIGWLNWIKLIYLKYRADLIPFIRVQFTGSQ